VIAKFFNLTPDIVGTVITWQWEILMLITIPTKYQDGVGFVVIATP
jgi:hypothetical protein